MIKTKKHNFVGLDVGAKRLGVAQADSDTKLAFPLSHIEVDGQELSKLGRLFDDIEPAEIVIGYPRNQSGESTKQTVAVEEFAKKVEALGVPIVFQDESLTSVMAEEKLKSHKKPFAKGEVDSMAATLILQDYLEAKYGY